MSTGEGDIDPVSAVSGWLMWVASHAADVLARGSVQGFDEGRSGVCGASDVKGDPAERGVFTTLSGVLSAPGSTGAHALRRVREITAAAMRCVCADGMEGLLEVCDV
ncbi:hypothetical protein FYJ43_11500 [Cutibacterium sp. WCA-380-WT-3A]|uniref:Uncharacterized protein n=1 Tax=Cutibacterium porci TaxID=2605781 RepID=A0A7K0J9Y1_9ACTN|nr:hypothetical protein [Cutibacterium porci]MSS46623.1 hypothetical protein [Cutibacterium porci]